MEYVHLLLLWMVFLGFFLHGLVFLIKDSRSTLIIDAALMDFRYWLKLSKVFLSDGIPTLITFLHTLHVIQHYFCSKWCEDNSDNKNDHFILMVLLLIMQIVLLLKYNPILYYLKSSKFFFHTLSCILKRMQDLFPISVSTFPLSIYVTLRTMLNHFSINLFQMEILSLHSYIYL